MFSKQTLNKNKQLIAVVLIGLAVLMFASGSLPLGSIGYSQGTQGIDFQFNSVIWSNNTVWSQSEFPPGNFNPSSSTFGYSMDLDMDARTLGRPDLCGEMGAFTVLNNGQPDKTYTWNLTNVNSDGSKTVTQFEMYRYACNQKMNVWLSGDVKEATGEIAPGVFVNPSWSGTQLWLKAVPTNFVYFEKNPDEFHIAPVSFITNSVNFYSTDKSGALKPDTEMAALQDISPKGSGVSMGIYYQRGGNELSDLTEQTLQQYQGNVLDMSIFRSTYWTKINLIDFRPKAYYSWGGLFLDNYKFPSVQIDLQVYVFVVGKWVTNYQPNEVPVLEAHRPIYNANPSGVLSFFDSFLKGLDNLFGSALVFIVLVICAVAAAYILFSRKKRSGSSSTGKSYSADGSGKTLGLSTLDWGVIGLMLLLAVLPDPTDIADLGLPLIEPAIAGAYYLWRRKK